MRSHVLVFLFFIQFFAACQQANEKITAVAASSLSGAQPGLETPPNILFQSTDNGQTWQNVSAGLPDDQPVDCFYAKNGEVILGFGDQLYRSPSGANAPVWEQEALLNEAFSDIYPGSTGLYGVHYAKGFFHQISRGLWLPVFPELKNQLFRALFESKNGDLFVGCDSGIFKSHDGGKTWKHVVELGWMLKMVESNGVLLCTSQQGILRSADGGDTWEVVVSEGGVGIDVAVIEGGFAEISYNTESHTRRMRISEDGGKTWQPIDINLRAQDSISGIVQVGKFLLCGHPDGIMRSSDGGQTWQLVFPTIDKKKVFNLSVSGGVIYAASLPAGC